MSLVLDLNSCYGWFLNAAYFYGCWFELKWFDVFFKNVYRSDFTRQVT